MKWIAVVVVAGCSDGDAREMRPDSGPCIDMSHDEDGDGIGDRCDICPAAPDPLQRDTTELATMIRFADGVGDACDPRPALEGDKLAVFHPFASDAEAARWIGSGFTITSDGARASGASRWNARTGVVGDGLYVQARMPTLAWTGTGNFDVYVDGDGVNAGAVCSIDSDGNLIAREIGIGASSKPIGLPVTDKVALSAWRVIDVTMHAELRCRVAFDGGTSALDLPLSDAFAVGTYGMSETAAATDVSSVVVYTSPTLPAGNN